MVSFRSPLCPHESLSLFTLSSQRQKSPFLLCLPLPVLSFLYFSCLAFPASVAPLHRHNLPPETIAGLFCKSSTVHEFYIGCTQSSVNTPTDHSGFTLPILPNTHAHAHSQPHGCKHIQPNMTPEVHERANTDSHNSPHRRISKHAAHSEHR